MSFALSPSRSMRRGPAYLQFGASWSAFIGAVAIGLTAASTEPALTLVSLGVLVVGAKLIWRPGEPPILFAAFALQWLQASLAVFRASLNGVELTSLYTGYQGVGDGIVTATWLSLVGLLVLALGIRLALRGVGPARTEVISEVQQFSLRKAFAAYCIAQVVAFGTVVVASWYPGLTQALLALSNFRWIFFFMLAVIVFVQRRGYLLLAFVCIFEVARGFLSFFSEYKDVFLVLILAFITARPKLDFRTVMASSLIASAVLVLSAAWSTVKDDYRDFLNEGTGRQVVLVGPAEQLNRISELLFNDGMNRLSEGFDVLVRRIEYTYFFGRIVEHVPSVLPHDDGAIWGRAVMHVLTPRLLFPDKEALTADVLNTQHYAGLMLVAQGGQDTEIPMGYMAESYIDFGSVGMFVPIFLLGLLYGGQYRYIITRRHYLMLAFGVAPVLMMPMSKFETTAVKIIGGSLITFGVFAVAFSLFAPAFYRMLLSAKRTLPPRFANGNNH
jgi:hypothetical protein